MDDKKEIMNEQAINDAAETSSVRDMPEIKMESAAANTAVAGKWGSSAVTKKFLTLALAATILINAGVTAGVMALTAKHNGHDIPDMHKGGRPGSEMFSENRPGGNGQMTPPQRGQNNTDQKAPPADTQTNTQDQSGNESEKVN